MHGHGIVSVNGDHKSLTDENGICSEKKSKIAGRKPARREAGCSLGLLVDQPGIALAREIEPDPLDADEQPLLKVDEKVDVDERP